MSRVIVRNLPEKVTKEKLTELFSQKGILTDVQLKFTKSGKFRKFAFVGFKEESQAKDAVEAFNKSFINASQIYVELCSGLTDVSKPRAWSKHTPTSSAYKDKTQVKEPAESNDSSPTKRKKIKEKKKINDPKVEELLKSHKCDEFFKEFLEAHLPDHDTLWENIEEDEDEPTTKKAADQDMSDSQYLKTKVGKKMVAEDTVVVKKDSTTKSIKLFTVKLIGLPYKVKKSDIKSFLDPLKPFTVRIPLKVKGIAYCGFKTELSMKKALNKNKSFMSGKRILVVEQQDTFQDHGKVNNKWKQQEDRLKNEEGIAESGRIFLRNLPYTVTEEDITKMFEKYGPVAEVILPVDEFSRKLKGYGIVTYLIPEHACQAFNELDGTVFQGRMLHLLPGLPSRGSADDENSDGTFKQKKLNKQKMGAGNTINWNTFFISENRLAESMAASYNTTKESVLDGSGAAVRLALGETQIVSQSQEFLQQNGVDLEAFTNMTKCVRSKTIILLKNLPYGTDVSEIREKFAAFGELARMVLPPNGSAALVEFIEPSEARRAFRRLAYSKFKHLPLYLEWAPEKVFLKVVSTVPKMPKVMEPLGAQEAEEEAVDEAVEPAEGSTLFVKNLNFTTNARTLREHFAECGKITSVTVAEKKDPNRPGVALSMGYGFITFTSKDSADKALKTLQGSTLQDYQLELKRSNRTVVSQPGVTRKAENTKNKPSTKIIVRNVPFQATYKEMMQMLKTFGEIKALRLPKKMVGSGSHRGFCFVEYSTIKEAKLAFKALSQSTHLYGRRLVLEWASTDDDSVDVIREKTAQRFKNFSSSDKGNTRKNISIEDVPVPDEI